MLLPVVVRTSEFTLQSTVLTKIEPGETVEVIMQIQSASPFEISDIAWKLIDPLITDTNSLSFPVFLGANETKELKYRWRNFGKEGFGEIQATLKYRTSSTASEMKAVTWVHWISVFKRTDLGMVSSLDDPLRDRLIRVVNTRLINGFLYMADFQKFFDHYLNIGLPGPLAQKISQQLNLGQQGLPADEETFYRIATGEVSYYGIDKFELIAEEECVESDDRFDAEDSKEVRHPDIDV